MCSKRWLPQRTVSTLRFMGLLNLDKHEASRPKVQKLKEKTVTGFLNAWKHVRRTGIVWNQSFADVWSRWQTNFSLITWFSTRVRILGHEQLSSTVHVTVLTDFIPSPVKERRSFLIIPLTANSSFFLHFMDIWNNWALSDPSSFPSQRTVNACVAGLQEVSKRRAVDCSTGSCIYNIRHTLEVQRPLNNETALGIAKQHWIQTRSQSPELFDLFYELLTCNVD